MLVIRSSVLVIENDPPFGANSCDGRGVFWRQVFQGESCHCAAFSEMFFFKMLFGLHAFPSKSLAAM